MELRSPPDRPSTGVPHTTTPGKCRRANRRSLRSPPVRRKLPAGRAPCRFCTAGRVRTTTTKIHRTAGTIRTRSRCRGTPQRQPRSRNPGTADTTRIRSRRNPDTADSSRSTRRATGRVTAPSTAKVLGRPCKPKVRGTAMAPDSSRTAMARDMATVRGSSRTAMAPDSSRTAMVRDMATVRGSSRTAMAPDSSRTAMVRDMATVRGSSRTAMAPDSSRTAMVQGKEKVPDNLHMEMGMGSRGRASTGSPCNRPNTCRSIGTSPDFRCAACTAVRRARTCRSSRSVAHSARSSNGARRRPARRTRSVRRTGCTRRATLPCSCRPNNTACCSCAGRRRRTGLRWLNASPCMCRPYRASTWNRRRSRNLLCVRTTMTCGSNPGPRTPRPPTAAAPPMSKSRRANRASPFFSSCACRGSRDLRRSVTCQVKKRWVPVRLFSLARFFSVLSQPTEGWRS